MSARLLQLAAMLLGRPDENSLPTLRELATEHAWLRPPVDELMDLPLQEWQGEHTRLFINGYPKTPCAPFESIYRHGRMAGPACGWAAPTRSPRRTPRPVRPDAARQR